MSARTWRNQLSPKCRWGCERAQPLWAKDVAVPSKPELARRTPHSHIFGHSPEETKCVTSQTTRVGMLAAAVSVTTKRGRPFARVLFKEMGLPHRWGGGDFLPTAARVRLEGAAGKPASKVYTYDSDCVKFSKRPNYGGRVRGCCRLRRGDAVTGQLGPEITNPRVGDTEDTVLGESGHRKGEAAEDEPWARTHLRIREEREKVHERN